MSKAIVKGELEIAIQRKFNAPRELVYDAWLTPESIGKWWGPRGFTTTTETMDVRPGGRWKYVMHGPDGTDYPNEIVYEEVVRPERLVYKHSGGREGDHLSFRATVTFAAVGEQTEITMSMTFSIRADRDRVVKEYGAVEGLDGTMDRLEAFLG